MAHGTPPLFSTMNCSAKALVYVYVFGRGETRLGVRMSIMSSSSHLKQSKGQSPNSALKTIGHLHQLCRIRLEPGFELRSRKATF